MYRSPSVVRKPYGLLPSGQRAHIYILTSLTGITVKITDYGGIIVSILAPDRMGHFSDIVLGHEALEGYFSNKAYFGALIGRVANRIAGAAFTLDGRVYHLTANNGPNALHGGARGFDQVLWKARSFQRVHERGIKLAHVSPDGDEGFPGELRVEATYTLNDRNELSIDYAAQADHPTLVNLTQHSYFNLNARPQSDVLDHMAWIDAKSYLPVDRALIPTGAFADVAGGAFDFRSPRRFGECICRDDPQINLAQGYDHNFILNKSAGELASAVSVTEPRSGRVLEVSTTEPGLQLYTGNQLDGSIIGKAQTPYRKFGGFTLETQHFPDTPHHSGFPSIVLRPGRTLHSRTVYRFAVNGEASTPEASQS